MDNFHVALIDGLLTGKLFFSSFQECLLKMEKTFEDVGDELMSQDRDLS